MRMATIRRPSSDLPVISMEIIHNGQWVASERPTLNKDWLCTDSNGHEHAGRDLDATLLFVVDRSHWCDGTEGIYNHDPHEAIDESHYECRWCGETVEPGTHPPGHRFWVPGSIEATVDRQCAG